MSYYMGDGPRDPHQDPLFGCCTGVHPPVRHLSPLGGIVSLIEVSPANEVSPGVWIGRHPTGTVLAKLGIDLLVLCAHTLQQAPADKPARCQVLCAPLTDHAFRIVDGDLERSGMAASRAARAIAAGKRVLFTCREGMNRSSWVAGQALVAAGRHDGAEAVAIIQAKRPGALYNHFFKTHLLGLIRSSVYASPGMVVKDV